VQFRCPECHEAFFDWPTCKAHFAESGHMHWADEPVAKLLCRAPYVSEVQDAELWNSIEQAKEEEKRKKKAEAKAKRFEEAAAFRAAKKAEEREARIRKREAEAELAKASEAKMGEGGGSAQSSSTPPQAEGEESGSARSSAPPALATQASLAEQIKSLQRSDPDSKQVWWDYCDKNLGGVKDPNRHEPEVLSQFLGMYGAGGCTPMTTSRSYSRPQASYAAAAQAWPMWGAIGGGGGGGGGGNSLAEFVKMGQRKSQNWKAAWQTYCVMLGNGKNDPAHYDESFITGFIDYVGQLAYNELGTQAEQQGIVIDGGVAAGGMKRPLGASSVPLPPAKRMAGAYAGGDAFAGGSKMRLVDKIKALQRSSPEAKAAWWAFCDEQAGGIKDPNRHEESTLQSFLAGYE